MRTAYHHRDRSGQDRLRSRRRRGRRGGREARSAAVRSWRSSAHSIPAWSAWRPALGAHYWARGADRRSATRSASCRPPTVKPYVEARQDRCGRCRGDLEAVTRPTMRFVPGSRRSARRRFWTTRRGIRWRRQRVAAGERDPAHLSEFGIVVAKGIHNVDRLLAATTELPAAARPAVDHAGRSAARDAGEDRRGDAGSTRPRGPTRSPGVWRRSRGSPPSRRARSPPRRRSRPSAPPVDYAAWLAAHAAAASRAAARSDSAGSRRPATRSLNGGSSTRAMAQKREAVPPAQGHGRLVAAGGKPVLSISRPRSLARMPARVAWALIRLARGYRIVPADRTRRPAAEGPRPTPH